MRQMPAGTGRHKKSGKSLIIVSCLMLAITGCAKGSLTTGSVPKHLRKPVSQMTMSELQQTTEYWQSQYQRNPKDKRIGMQFAAALRTTGRNEQALAVMQQVVIHHPDDRQVLANYGKALAGAGDLPKALKTIQRAQTPDNPDWKLHSAEGAIYDQLGQPKLARLQYRKALDLKPNETIGSFKSGHVLPADRRPAVLRNIFEASHRLAGSGQSRSAESGLGHWSARSFPGSGDGGSR